MNFSPRNQMAARRAAQRKRPDRIISILLILSLLFGNLAGFPSAAAELTSYCGKEGHVHTEECYKVAVTTEPTETEGGEETTSETTEAMEETEAAQTVILSDTPVCGKEEHTHTLKCYSNPDADVETAANWEATLPETLTGTWADDLLATVRSQVGYKESVENFIVEADGETTSGYNRYGAWYGSYTQDENQPYLPWNITFLFFSIYYSNIDDFPLEETCPDWIDSLDYYGLYRAAGEYTPAEGDLVFVDTDGDGEADRVGVVSEVKDNKLIAIEGDYEGAVAEVTYDLPELTVEPETTETEGTTEIDVSVSMNALLLLSDGTEEGDEAPQPTVVGYGDTNKAQAQVEVSGGENAPVLYGSLSQTKVVYLDVSNITWWSTNNAEMRLFYKSTGSTSWKYSAAAEATDTANLLKITVSDLDISGTADFHVKRVKPGTVTTGSTNEGSAWNSWQDIEADDSKNKLTLYENSYSWSSDWVEGDDSGGGGGGGNTGDVTTTLPAGPASGYKRVYFDARLASLSYSGDSKNGSPYPSADGGTIYCYVNGSTINKVEMEKINYQNAEGKIFRDVYYADISSSATSVRFSNYDISSGISWTGDCTDNLSLPGDNQKSCFYADPSDDSIYRSYDGNVRGGYWDEPFQIMDPGTVVDIPDETKENAANTLYVGATFYDYYTDYELGGNNRDTYDENATKTTHRIYQPFRHFNQALSSYYSGINASNPLYWGNFQNYSGDHFDEIADTLNLYGYSNNKNKFFAENNSMWGYNGGELTNDNKDGAQATMGLVSDALANGNLMIKTSGDSAIAPYFSKSFLEGGNSKNTVLGKVYENVSFPFTKKPLTSSSDPDATGTVDYWVFDSRDTTLRLKEDSTDGYWLDSTDVNAVYGSTPDKASTEKQNFFPFNSGSQSAKSQQLNYGFATKLELKFRLTEKGTVKTTNTADDEEVPIEFNFSGDDDVWVFIDGKLALDVGGGHGRVAGYLNFKDKKYHVDRVKGSSSGVENNKEGLFEMSGANTDEHTLTMFYMERGLWESNMMITFNFPDENQLEVKKEVDTTDVNSLFNGVFENKSLFTFNIKNLATHYGAVSVEGSNLQPVTLDTTSASNKVSLTAYGSNIFDRWKLDAFGNDDSIVHWYANQYDTSSDYREKRYGTMWLNTGDGSPNIVDLSKMSYMEFEVYFQDATPSLSKMYIQLKDTAGNVLTKDDDSKPYLSNSVYGSVSPQKNQWFKVRLSLSNMLASSVEEGTKLGYIRFGYDEPVNIFLRGFKFLPAVSASENNVGFVKQQYAIPDYGSATTGILKPATGAVYSSDKTNALTRSTLGSVDTEGNFVLSKDETATFYNQFRRGSYIALQEIVSSELFETKWTMYENSKPVTSMGTGDTVTNGNVTSLNGVTGTAVEDGRTEKYTTGSTDGNTIVNKYDGTKPSSESAFVFRSYVHPDNTTSATKLKVVFTNKVKTGSLTIAKQNAGTTNLTGTFTFYVVFTNVGGMSLESAPIVKGPITLSVGDSETISGIPINTEYAVYEIKSDNANITLDHITDDVYTDKYPYEVTTYKVDGTDKGAYMASGVIDGETNNVTYYNIEKEVVSLKLTKLWEGLADGEEPPMSIKVQLQCSTDGTNWSQYNDYYAAKDIGPGYGSWNGYTFEFTNLDKYVSGTTTEYKYRVVELDSEGEVITSTNDVKGVLDIDGTKYEVTYGTVEKAKDGEGNEIDNQFTQTITNKLKPKAKVTVTKAWNVPTDVTQPESVTVQLQRRTLTNAFAKIDDSHNAILNSTNNWTYTFDDLEEKDSNNVAYEYRVVELDSQNAVISANGTVTISNVDYRVTYSGTDGKATLVENTTNEYTQTITNSAVPEVTLQITKLDATDTTKKLDGVVFKLEKKDDNTFTAMVVTTDGNGIASFAGLKAGTYTLTETKAKSGYSLLKSSITIEITESTDATSGAISYTATVDGTEVTGDEFKQSGNVYTLAKTIYNKPNLTMPATGGVNGFEFWILGGLCMMAVPLLLYTFFWFKKGGKYLRK